MENLQKGSKKLLNAWAFYDWANSVYTLTIASSIFPIFYSALFINQTHKVVNAFGFEFKSTALITFITAFTFLVVAFTSPILSGIADYVGNKKNFLKFFCYVGGLGCIGLYFFSLDHIYISLLFYFMGLIGYWGSLVFYNSYLPDIAFPEQQDSISAKGFSLGYIGSVILLIINLIMVMTAEDGQKMDMMRYSFVMVGIWWIGFSQYSFYWLPKGTSKGHKVTKEVVLDGFNELKVVWKALQENILLKKYLQSFFVFSMAVQTIMLVAVYFGEEEINWGSDDAKTMGLIVSILIIQLIAIVGAVLTSKASSKFGNIKTLIAVNFIWMSLCFYAYFMETPIQFYIAASCVGFVMGGIQSLARSTYSKFLPETKDTTSYFSFFDVAEKIGIVIGMGIYGTIDQVTGSMRNSILFLFIFFLIGIILLFRVLKQQKLE
ncbi:UMF1 family MFS transporter [Mesoflavibacter sabulilitoris]|uniref:MFS transporter n=1 Tax=Mesoflavibacter zeaxanthinifaciens subsp. sabulilitoris TaxID=1520893 RepID=A0A2T1NEU9_9FLAO|nr:MFS transporter [Mesoflavibacter zeaxanthinifaciens]MBB3124950.1 UMF1 family MFS transporter [Mesoflavibacter zeaxanthinifaciens subsp. sabulilitoris]PSG90972.1 MFS transporter [Mesoflavibacter zeaxanthinifaciens subsp. sabulilitoris]